MTTLTPLEQAERCLTRAGDRARRDFTRLLLLSYAAECLRGLDRPALAERIAEARYQPGQPELDLLYEVRALIRMRALPKREAA